mgnify:CR=1 FL=1
MTTGELADAAQACKLSMEQFHEKSVIVSFGGAAEYDELLHQLPKLQAAEIVHIDFPALPELEIQGIYAETAMEKQEWKVRIKDQSEKSSNTSRKLFSSEKISSQHTRSYMHSERNTSRFSQQQKKTDRSFLSEFHQVHKRITSITPQHTLKYTKTD